MPLWLSILSDQLPVVGLVGRYPTNYLIGRRLIPKRPVKVFTPPKVGTIKYYPRFLGAILYSGEDSYVLLSRLPLYPNLAVGTSFDLHISGTPPAFILSQDQTLKKDLKVYDF